MKPARRLLIVVLVILPLILNLRQANAQSEIQLEQVGAVVDFGEQITFTATVRASIPIQETSIIITDESQDSTHIEPLSLGQDGRTEFRFDTQQKILSPFGNVNWHYRFTLPDGGSIQSQIYSIRYEDNRFDWQMLESGPLRVHWYGGDAGFGQAALMAAGSGLDSVSQLLSTGIDQPVDFYIYSSLNDLRGTLLPGSREWVAGHADPGLGVVMVAVEPGPGQETLMRQRIPHELMHVVLYRAVKDTDHNIPAWLNEGMAGLAEMVPNTDYERALQESNERGDGIPVSSLCRSFPADTGRALLAYAESQSFTGYLHEKYGSTGLSKLADIYARGANCDLGLELAFGIPLSKLEQNWQNSMADENAVLPGLHNIMPYLVLLCLILIIPAIGIAGAVRRKGNLHEPESFITK